MRRVAWILLLLFAFTIPWEYSLDLGGRWATRRASRVCWCCSRRFRRFCKRAACALLAHFGGSLSRSFSGFAVRISGPSIRVATLEKIRGYFQEMMIVWLMWEFADTPADLRSLLRATVAGSWVLALLTLAAFSSPEAIAAGQVRFAAYGQDPNEVARFLDLGFPLAALLVNCERRWPPRLLALGFFPLGIFAVLLTASRERIPGRNHWHSPVPSFFSRAAVPAAPSWPPSQYRLFWQHSGSSFLVALWRG